ncbi:hypothetical protein Acr_00g0055500 [Actinidia rufa]|uniref:NIN like protein 7 n=1 Tax=Actinidia rufa TaxID=165716 RepID=A0A7J0DM36_9ERIC|nr:hypothetical protein Acr_00g0055500 [Actinidia rufa]
MGSIIFQEMAEPEIYWTKAHFKEHVHNELNWSRIGLDGIPRDGHPISDNDWHGNWNPYNWIFWSKKHDDSDPLMTLPYGKIKLALRNLLFYYRTKETLVQFWAATKTSDGRTLLTTKDQPFGLNRLSHRLCQYRMLCKDYKFYVDGRNGEEELGIPGRVYRSKCPECTPNVAYYSVKENPLRGRALFCGVRQSLTLPVIERSSQMCVGVMELVGEFCFWSFSHLVYAAFQGLGLEYLDSCEHYETREKNDNKAHKNAFVEIKRVLKLLCKIYKLRLALTWVLCGACKTLLLVEDLYMVRDDDDGTISDLDDFCMSRFGLPLRNWIRLVGRVFSSPNLLYYSDVTQLSMAEYPLAHFAREWRLKGCFTISLRSNYTGNDVYVLEIFLPANNKDQDPLSSLSKILETMKKEFKTFTLAYGEVMGKELSVEVIEFQHGQKRHYVHTLQVTGSLPSLEPLQNGGEIIQVDSSDHQSIHAEQCVIDVNHLQELGTKKTSVSISTFKRVCRQYGINRWPPRNVDKVRTPRPSHVDHQEEVPQLNSNLPSNKPQLFWLSPSSGLVELQQQVAKRLNLEAGSYHIKYKDEEDELILIACDEDLKDCIRTFRSPGSNAVVLHIDPISQVYHTVSYIDCFPASLRQYIRNVKDVASDGNCGFRAIAGLMGIGEEDGWVQVRRDLLTELNLHVDDYKRMYGGQQGIDELTHYLSWFNGRAGMDRWMTMPDMGHLIASRYNVVLYHLSNKQCLTFLPLRSLPIPATSRKEITIGFIFLFSDHPVPPVAGLWMQHRYPCAQGWDTAYNLRIQHFRKLVDSNVATTDVISVD